ncbi:MAG: hypothetical protein ABZF75_01205, partial [Columbia Basin potato purple top phytoplasma]
AHNKKAKDADQIQDKVKTLVKNFKDKVTNEFKSANDVAKFKEVYNRLNFPKFITDLKTELGDIVKK